MLRQADPYLFDLKEDRYFGEAQLGLHSIQSVEVAAVARHSLIRGIRTLRVVCRRVVLHDVPEE
jgi:hypothetical protein